MDENEVMSEEEVAQKESPATSNRAFYIKCFVFVVLTIVIMKVIFTPVILKSAKKTEMTQAVSNSKQIYLILMDFESDRGCFPDDASAASVPSLNSFKGDYSNDYLGQLLAGGYTKSEEIFFAYDKRFKNEKPDNVISPPSRILEKNECGFTYAMVEEKGKRRGLSTSDIGSLPILITPLVNEWGSMEMESHIAHGCYLRVDGSARFAPLHPVDHKVHLKEGGTLLDFGPASMWGDLKPVILLPER